VNFETFEMDATLMVLKIAIKIQWIFVIFLRFFVVRFLGAHADLLTCRRGTRSAGA